MSARSVPSLVLLLLATSVVNHQLAAAAQLQENASWRSCGNADVFAITAVDLEPGTTIARGGSLMLTMSGTSQQQVTAGLATVTVYYYGFRVLTASDTLCTAAVQHPLVTPATGSTLPTSSGSSNISMARKLLGFPLTVRSSSSRSSSSSNVAAGLQDDTCAMPAGPLVLKHAANLPGVAPPGNYRMRLAASDVITQQELMCVDVWFKVS
ncbi:hypothetical protein OEZ85_008063 [Tetradesmus obliquus]|uniref:MD-2-related lipid-recognition domain-containing protein n=1 Tax=Tetradesmus obliquus TaxID=3088 RepID=A0ABY8THS3_TETOB|nr:hypothetical protein OEZ85_008063 [Tetradesmus obliquus]